MYSELERQPRLQGFKPGKDRFLAEVISGLRKAQKELPSKYFYDDHGSYLYERICTLDEYYIPRIEESIMEAYIKEMAELVGPKTLLIEYGSGDCKKVRILLDHLLDPVAYVPIDISRKQLLRATENLSSSYPTLEVLPVCTDYSSNFKLPEPERKYQRVLVYFPGSTIGNFDPIPAKHFLEHIAQVCGPSGSLLIGVDLKKDPAVLHRAYNDSHGITSAFNLNLLHRINQEL
ncbi:L-histidine N(alpha)-methyltransferase, partial [Chloroflexota bacterium]